MQIEGHDALILENDLLRVVLVPGVQALIHELIFKPKNLNVLHESKFGLHENSGRWTEIHGPYRASLLNQSAQSCAILLKGPNDSVTRIYSLRDNDAVLRINSTRENHSDTDIDLLWAERLTLGERMIDEHCRIETPATSYFDPAEQPILRMRWPHLADGTDISHFQKNEAALGRSFYLTDFTEGRCRVNSPTQGAAFEMRWDASKFPYCWLTSYLKDLTWAPATGMPDALSEGHGFITLPPGGRETAWFEAGVSEI